MIKFFCGKDRDKARAAWRAAIKQARQAAGVYHEFEAHNFAPVQIEELAAARDLFGGSLAVALDEVASPSGPAGEALAREFLISRVPALAASPTIFIWYEEAPPAALTRALEKAEVVVKKFDKKDKEERRWFDASALARRDRRALWLAYQRELAGGGVAEEIFWPIQWQLRQLLAAGRGGSYQAGELERLSSGLVALWQETHSRPGRDLALSLERWILGV
jgi:hypothetical protein